MNLSANLRAAAQLHPDKVALIGDGRFLTHFELDQAAVALAASFVKEGFRPGERVAIHSPNSIDAVIAVLACFHGGFVAVPINIRFKPDEVDYVLSHCDARLLIAPRELAAPLLEVLDRAKAPPKLWTELPASESTVNLPIPPADSAALILYTSGTTGRPKGVTHSLRTLAASTETIFGFGFNESTIALVAMSIMHTAGLCATLLPALVKGGSAVLLPRFDPGALLDLVERHGCTWTLVLPALMHALANEQESRPRDLGSMRIWACGGDCVPAALEDRWKRLSGRSITEGYAMSECMIISYNRDGVVQPGSAGRAAELVEIAILDGERRQVPCGSVGQIAVRSPATFTRYWNDPDATREAKVDGWLLTGDRGRLDTDRNLWFEGRLKELIICGGSNISPQEVEDALMRHPTVLEAGVVGSPHPVMGEVVIAFITVQSGCTVDEGAILDRCRSLIADYKVPERIVVLSDMPKGPTGKVQRRILKALLEQ